MKSLSAGVFIAAASFLLSGSSPNPNSEFPLLKSNLTHMETKAMHHASGTFEVKLTPRAQDDESAEQTLGSLSIDKEFQGDLAATSKGQMLAFRSDVKGSAGYVAMERVTGSLDGRRGSFVLQHSGTMTRGEPQLSVTVVPDSGTDELAGLVGTMVINIIDGKHEYEFDYTLSGVG